MFARLGAIVPEAVDIIPDLPHEAVFRALQISIAVFPASERAKLREASFFSHPCGDPFQLPYGLEAVQAGDPPDGAAGGQRGVLDPLCLQAGLQKPGEQEGVHIIDQRQIPLRSGPVHQGMIGIKKLLAVSGTGVH